MNKLTIVIGDSINFIILALAIITLFGFVYVLLKLSQLQGKMDDERKKSGGRRHTDVCWMLRATLT